jgi:hypothetical protein
MEVLSKNNLSLSAQIAEPENSEIITITTKGDRTYFNYTVSGENHTVFLENLDLASLINDILYEFSLSKSQNDITFSKYAGDDEAQF